MSVTTVSILLLLSLTSLSRLINVTIDDEYGDERTGLRPEYEPGESWEDISDNGDVILDFSLVHARTLHAHLGDPAINAWGNISLTFNGTAIYVFFILDPDGYQYALFYLDGALRASRNYTRPATPTSILADPLYNQLAYHHGALESGTHNLLISIPPHGAWSFDYALYTTEDGNASEHSITTGSQASPDPSSKSFPSTVTPHPSSPSKVGPTVGASLAGGVLVIALCAWALHQRRGKRQAQRQAKDNASDSTAAGVVPFAVQPAEPLSGITPPTNNEKSNNPLKQTGRVNGSSTTEGGGTWVPEGSENIAFFRAELERMRAESERARAESERARAESQWARAENERVREELELLRRVAVPPPYSDGGRSNAVELS